MQMKNRAKTEESANGNLEAGIFQGGELEPGTFHGDELEPGTFFHWDPGIYRPTAQSDPNESDGGVNIDEDETALEPVPMQ